MSFTPVVTPEEVREMIREAFQIGGPPVEEVITKHLRSKGLLQENKPLLKDRRLRLSSDPRSIIVEIREPEIDAHQSALDRVRDDVRALIADMRRSEKEATRPCDCNTENWLRMLEVLDAQAVREGCWSPPPEAP